MYNKTTVQDARVKDGSCFATARASHKQVQSPVLLLSSIKMLLFLIPCSCVLYLAYHRRIRHIQLDDYSACIVSSAHTHHIQVVQRASPPARPCTYGCCSRIFLCRFLTQVRPRPHLHRAKRTSPRSKCHLGRPNPFSALGAPFLCAKLS